MEFKIKKEVVFGNHYVEHRYPSCTESWIGVWKKTGHQVLNGSLFDLCSSCGNDVRTRTRLGAASFIPIIYYHLQ